MSRGVRQNFLSTGGGKGCVWGGGKLNKGSKSWEEVQ